MAGFRDLFALVLHWWSSPPITTGTPVCLSLTVEVLNQPAITLEVC
jgi:hypothetical protein